MSLPADPDPDSQELIEMARRDADKAIYRDMSQPYIFAGHLPLQIQTALLSASCCKDGWYVSLTLAPLLRPYGLCDVGCCFLGSFGVRVLKALKKGKL
jgi:hypothetical protein